MKLLLVLTGILIALGLILVIATVTAWPLMPVIFGLVKITFWQAFGLVFLCSLLFKSPNTGTSNE